MFLEVRGRIFLQVIIPKTPWQVSMRELARILIHVRKIFNCTVSFKMLLSVFLVIVEKEL